MLHDDTYTNDLEYLAQQGFEKVPVTSADLDNLVKQVKTRTFSYNSGLYFGFIALLTGVFIGASLFFVMDNSVEARVPVKSAPALTDAPPAVSSEQDRVIELDTLTVTKENFVNPQARYEKAIVAAAPVQQVDSVMSIPVKPIDMTQMNKEPVSEARLKFIANAPVHYIHDLKVTNYALLYFKKNHFVKFTDRPGLSADYSSAMDVDQTAPHFKQSADYFLHEELAEALLHFKRGQYNRCISSLNIVATYNDNDINCDFYLGMCYYYKHQYTKAIGLFDSCIGNLNNTFLQEASYYKALSLSESGSKAEAAALLKQISEEDGFYAEKAKVFLSK